MAICGLVLGLEVHRRLRTRNGAAWIPAPARPLPDTVVACAVALFLYVLGLMAVGGIVSGGDEAASPVVVLLAGSGLNLVFALALLPVARHESGVEAPPRRLLTAGIWTGLATFGLVHLLGIALIVLYAALGLEVPAQEVVELVRDAEGGRLVLAGVAAVVVAPLAEEVFFRGVLLPAFARYLPVKVAVVLQALVFGLSHFPGDLDRLPLAIPLAVVGLVAGALYVRTRSLMAVILLHATFNGVQFALLLASR